MAKCYKCLRGARLNVRGVNHQTTLEMDIGGALLFVMPKENGKIEVHLNSENLVDGNYAFASWDGKKWSYNAE